MDTAEQGRLPQPWPPPCPHRFTRAWFPGSVLDHPNLLPLRRGDGDNAVLGPHPGEDCTQLGSGHLVHSSKPSLEGSAPSNRLVEHLHASVWGIAAESSLFQTRGAEEKQVQLPHDVDVANLPLGARP